ncbi:carboxymuconolactone decarboxylase family protein [Mucilaginibacter limnophilus]|uniref:Carboxymuconolactone decarboxylase family protein n=1 Tax=Mucilaginibacter limnophilus TaxID=1932778 RepID=A0A437MLF6_9SPHI|nr:carboxymuconolactone decarboxylase family protein [Mucilaginibacter limnophilus]RVT98494.1 carboxymuconolactone decarboxylase family protein [Mucilaginibacter limnophilus]
MKEFIVPTRKEVSPANQQLFDTLEKNLGMMPNLYAYFAKNETALADYLALQNRKSTLTAKEREVINLVVSQVNNCKYCLAAHTTIAKMFGYTDEEVMQIRLAAINFDHKLAALAMFVKDTTVTHGEPSAETKEALFDANYTEQNLIDILMVIGDKIISNYLHKITRLPIDFPEVD